MPVRSLPALAVAVLAAACSTLQPERVATGTSADAVQQRLGAPTGRFALPGGGTRLEYARGPYGTQTWMFDFDASDRLQSVDQVLTESRFSAIRAGMSRDEVRMSIGKPSEESVIPRQRQIVWSYRYHGPFCQWFQVGLDSASGRVVDTTYAPDPLCDKDDVMGLNL